MRYLNNLVAHPLFQFVGRLIGYGLALYGAIIVGAVIGILINEELAQYKKAEPLWYQLPNRDLVPPPDVFPELA
jgi:hypothetical protein